MLASFYHEGYEGPLLELIRRRGVPAGLVIKVRFTFCMQDLKARGVPMELPCWEFYVVHKCGPMIVIFLV